MKKIFLIAGLVIALSPTFALATGGSSEGSAGGSSEPFNIAIDNPVGAESLADLFYLIVNFIIGFSYAVIAFFLILSGFKFVAAQGSEDKLKDAKNTFKYTILGAVIIIGAQTIISVVQGIITSLGE
jgi:hypothetical protein